MSLNSSFRISRTWQFSVFSATASKQQNDFSLLSLNRPHPSSSFFPPSFSRGHSSRWNPRTGHPVLASLWPDLVSEDGGAWTGMVPLGLPLRAIDRGGRVMIGRGLGADPSLALLAPSLPGSWPLQHQQQQQHLSEYVCLCRCFTCFVFLYRSMPLPVCLYLSLFLYVRLYVCLIVWWSVDLLIYLRAWFLLLVGLNATVLIWYCIALSVLSVGFDFTMPKHIVSSCNVL